MRERHVIKLVALRLQAEGVLNLQVRYAPERGPDIEAQLPQSRRLLFLEAKGETKAPDVALGTALYQILTRYDGHVVCGVALPFTERYEMLVRNILPGVQRLGLHILFVKDEQVWYLSPNAAGFFPTKPTSLVEAIEK
jgi:hypothetical protein